MSAMFEEVGRNPPRLICNIWHNSFMWHAMGAYILYVKLSHFPRKVFKPEEQKKKTPKKQKNKNQNKKSYSIIKQVTMMFHTVAIKYQLCSFPRLSYMTRFSHYWPFVRAIYQSPVDFPHKRPTMQGFDTFFSLAWISG